MRPETLPQQEAVPQDGKKKAFVPKSSPENWGTLELLCGFIRYKQAVLLHRNSSTQEVR